VTNFESGDTRRLVRLTTRVRPRIIPALMTCVVVGLLVATSSAQLPYPGQAAPVDSSQQIADRIIKCKKPVLIDFWAPWCGPCRMLSPMLKELEKKYAGKIVVERVNVDINRNLASYFRVSGIPAVFLVKDRTVVKSMVGLQPREAYEKAINEAIALKVPPPPADTAAQGSPKAASADTSRKK